MSTKHSSLFPKVHAHPQCPPPIEIALMQITLTILLYCHLLNTLRHQDRLSRSPWSCVV